ncbi:MAG TPA: phage integrase N-terminal SAM-like domain-containing protein, partial [Pirellulales bacterium]|nr:phage integrase N-terminal SAM-like domain-containing protein [Pirellulales bacterium]
MTPLRQRLIQDLQLCNRSAGTIRSYVSHVVGLARHYRQSPERLSQEQVRAYLLHLTQERRV